jgi:hypothetical protein
LLKNGNGRRALRRSYNRPHRAMAEHTDLTPAASRRRSRIARVAVAFILAAACDQPPDAAAPPAPARPAAHAPRTAQGAAPAPSCRGKFPTFTDVARESGLAAHKLHAGRDGDMNWLLESLGGGAAVLDYDGDGRMDLLLVDGDAMSLEGEIVHDPDARTRLWHNDGDLRFTDVTEKAGIDLTGYGLAAAAADYDGDGHTDFVVTGYDFVRLFHNQGDGTFREVTKEAGLVIPTWDTNAGCAWGDLDGDGRLDLFVTGYSDQRAKILELREKKLPPRSAEWRGHSVYWGPGNLKDGRNHVFFQRADHTFEDRAAQCLNGEPSYSLQVVLTDVDGDGDLDAYVANDTRANNLYINDGKGHFVDRGVEAGAAGDADFHMQGSMGVDAADYDHDGRMDLFVTNFAHESDTLYHNVTARADRPQFQVVSAATRISLSPQGHVAWGTKLVDFDGDGELDAFIACGHIYAEDERDSHGRVGFKENLVIDRGTGGPAFAFEDVSAKSGAPFADRRLWRGAAFADFDDDGDWDVLVTALQSPPALLRNDGGNVANWIRLDLRGRAGLSSPAGARVAIHLEDGRTLHDELHLGSSYGCSNDPRLLLGVGDAKRVPRIEIRWPDGEATELTDVETRRTVVVREGAH